MKAVELYLIQQAHPLRIYPIRVITYPPTSPNPAAYLILLITKVMGVSRRFALSHLFVLKRAFLFVVVLNSGLQARLMSQALRKLTSSIAQSNTLVVFINQLRMKIGVMFGSPETTTGGNALKFYASVRLDIRRIGAIKDKEEIIGNQTRVKVVKNKVAPPFKVVEFDIMYGEGISKLGELVDLGVKAEIIDKSGSWFAYNDHKIGQGRDNVKTYLKENPNIAKEIETRILENAGIVEKAMMEGEISPEKKETDIIKEKE